MKKTNSHFQKGILLILAILFCQLSFAQIHIPDSVLKKNISNIYYPLQKITMLQPKVFEYDKERYWHLPLPKGRQYGFEIENMRAVFPEFVIGKTHQYSWGKNSYRNATVNEIDMQKMIPILVASIIEQQEQIENLKEEIRQIKKKPGSYAQND